MEQYMFSVLHMSSSDWGYFCFFWNRTKSVFELLRDRSKLLRTRDLSTLSTPYKVWLKICPSPVVDGLGISWSPVESEKKISAPSIHLYMESDKMHPGRNISKGTFKCYVTHFLSKSRRNKIIHLFLKWIEKISSFSKNDFTQYKNNNISP